MQDLACRASPPHPSQTTVHMSFGQFIAILRARWWVAALVFVVTVGATVAASLLLPKKYLATATVVVDFKPDPVSAMMFGGMASPAFMATQVDVIGSDRVAQRVVRNLKLAENPQVRAQWLEEAQGKGNIESWLAESFQKAMDVKPSRESSVISVSYKAPDPQFAAALANAFVQAYLETSLELRVDPAKQYSSFFDTRAKEARDTLERAQAKVSEFQKANGIIANDERLDVETARLNELSSQLVTLQAISSESGSRQAQANNGAGDKLQEVLNNPVVAGLKADLSRYEAKLQELNARLGDNHPQVVEAKANITALRSKLDAETRRVTGSVGVTATINRQRAGEVRGALEAQRTKLLRMKGVRDEGAVLLRDLETAQKAYETMVARFNQSTLESQNTQSNINVLTPASPPLEPASPKLLLNSLLSVFVGTLLGVGVALLLELMDRRVRTVDDVAAAMGLAVVGVLPKPKRRRFIGTNSAPNLMQQRMVGQLAAPAKGA
jgi:polysaccharide biosynthesis transport protein